MCSQGTCLTQTERFYGCLSILLHSAIFTEFGLQFPNCPRLTTPCKKPSSYKVTAWPLNWQRQSGHNPWHCDRECNSRLHFCFISLSLLRGDYYSCRWAGDWKGIYSVGTMCCVIGECVVVIDPMISRAGKGLWARYRHQESIREEDFSFMCCKSVASISVTVKKLRVLGKVFQSYNR